MIDAGIKRRVRNREFPCSLSQGHNASMHLNKDVGSCIVGLFGVAGPAAIIRFIAAIYVFAIKRHPNRAWTHGREKFLKTFSPFGTHGNTSASIIGETLIGRIKATTLSMMPTLIFSRIRKTMSSIAAGKFFRMEAPATRRRSGPETILADCFFCPTVATTKPIGISISVAYSLYHSQSSVTISGYINKFYHRTIIAWSQCYAK